MTDISVSVRDSLTSGYEKVGVDSQLLPLQALASANASNRTLAQIPVRALECAAPVLNLDPLAWRESDGEPV